MMSSSEPSFLPTLKKYLFIWLHWVLVVARGIFHCGEVAQAHELISCSVQAQLSHTMQDLSSLMEPMALALEDRFSTLGPTAKSPFPLYKFTKKVKSLSHVQLFVTPWTLACQAPLSMGFSRKEYWSGLPFPTPEHLPDPTIKPTSLSLTGRFLLTALPGRPCNSLVYR